MNCCVYTASPDSQGQPPFGTPGALVVASSRNGCEGKHCIRNAHAGVKRQWMKKRFSHLAVLVVEAALRPAGAGVTRVESLRCEGWQQRTSTPPPMRQQQTQRHKGGGRVRQASCVFGPCGAGWFSVLLL